MKKIIGALFAVFILCSIPTALAQTEVIVEFNSLEVEFDQPAIISENRTMVPLRKIFELLGAEVSWNGDNREAIAKREDREVSIAIGSNLLYVNGVAKEIDVPAKIMNNRTLVPLRAISEAFECDVYWNGEEVTAEIFTYDYKNAPKKDYITGNGKSFECFEEIVPNIADDGVISVKSGECVLTITYEIANDIVIDDEFLDDLKKGLEKFSILKIKYVKKIPEKNIAKLACYNKGNTIYYIFAQEEQTAYHLALTVPDGAQRYDAERLIYVMKSFTKAW